MTEVINPRTGLRETKHDFYGVPHVQQKGISTLKFHGQPTAVHTVPIGNGLTLDFYAKLGMSDELVVTLMGANLADKNFYPRFARVSSMRNRVPGLMAFADPTLLLDPELEMRLSWYLGGPALDPARLILTAVRKAQGKTGAKHVAFVGGSGGGFAALRMSAMVPGSLAFVQEPQTNIGNYIPHVVDTYFEKSWPGWDGRKLIEAFPDRFDMVRYYRETLPENFVYYIQSVADRSHVESHYNPFKAAFGVKEDSGVSRSGRMNFELYEGQIEGHGKIAPAEFDHHYGEAMAFWRAKRSPQPL